MKKPITIGNKRFKTQTECEKYTRSTLSEVGPTESVQSKNKELYVYLLELCKRHPSADDKLKNFMDFTIYRTEMNKNALAFSIVNHDRTLTEISWRVCVLGEHTSPEKLFKAALRNIISYQILNFKLQNDLSHCRECSCELTDDTVHIDHDKIQFIKLVADFLEQHKEVVIPSDYNKMPLTFMPAFKEADTWIGDLFDKYHLQHASLRVLCKNCNLTRKKHKFDSV